MNLLLLEAADLLSDREAIVTGRRAAHIAGVLRAEAGSILKAGVIDGAIGTATVNEVSPERVHLTLDLGEQPPSPLDVEVALALPRPKVLSRSIAAIASMGVKRIAIINSWRVDKAYWKSPRLEPDALRSDLIAGLEQARDTILPRVTLHRFLREWCEQTLPVQISEGRRAILAHPYAAAAGDDVKGPATLIVGPDGGFIAEEIAMFERAGAEAISFGPRVLRVETAIPWLLSRFA